MRGVTVAGGQPGDQTGFQPALPMRGVTLQAGDETGLELISTRTPHAGSDLAQFVYVVPLHIISTRTPHAGSDQIHLIVVRHDHISTRTPHAGSDTCAAR